MSQNEKHDDRNDEELKHFAVTMAAWIINGHDCHDKKGFGIHHDNVRGIAKAVLQRHGPGRFGPSSAAEEVPAR